MLENINKNVTLIIKTFDRVNSLCNLLYSIRKFYRDIPIIIINDGKQNCYGEIEHFNIDYRHLPFDSGASAGRNEGLFASKTKYICTLDEDFLFTEKTRLEEWYNILESTDIDIIGGNVRDGRYEAIFNFYDNNTNMRFLKTPKDIEGTIPIYDIILQFWMGRTNKIIAFGGWHEKFKTIDHLPFFLRAYNKVKIGYTNKVSIDHIPETNKDYQQFRHGRSEEYFQLLLKEFNLKRITGYHGNVIK